MADDINPPRWALNLLRRFADPNTLEEVEGDLGEFYGLWVREIGEKKANLRYAITVLTLLRPLKREDSKSKYYRNSTIPIMLSSYFKMSWRLLARSKVSSILTISGLALGLAASIIIFLIVRNELSFDKHYRKYNRTYRVTVKGHDYNPSVSFAVAPAFSMDFPEAESVSQYLYQQEGMVKVGSDRFNEKGYAYADENFTKIFDFNWLSGNPVTALRRPNSVVLTESYAYKYFGTTDVLGKIIRLDNKTDLNVTGVIRDLPSNTHLRFIFLVSWETVREELSTNNFWSIGGGYLYVTLSQGEEKKITSGRLAAFVNKHWKNDIDWDKGSLILQPVQDIHFDRRYHSQIDVPRSKESLYGLAAIGVFILLTACINFLNLYTAQSMRRSGEVGVRKSLGAFRIQLVTQMLTETTLLALISFILAIGIASVFIPYSEPLLNVRVPLSDLFSGPVLATLMAIVFCTIIVAGLYPAVVQSGLKPVQALKSNASKHGLKNSWVAKGLIVLQFTITQVLLAGTIVVGSQMTFLVNQDIGYDKDAIITLPAGDKTEVLRDRLSRLAGVQGLSFASAAPAHNDRFAPFSSPATGMPEVDVVEIKMIDENYLSMFKIPVLAGQGIIRSAKPDTIYRVVVNETLLRRANLGNPEAAIGKRFQMVDRPALIQGVVRDFQSEARYQKIRPCILFYHPESFWQASIKLDPASMRQTISAIDQIWTELNPDQLFSYEFMDDHIAAMYKQEQTVLNTFQLFSAVAIVIGCLGLYGLVSLMAVQRTKEIGIRKVLGSTTAGVVLLFFNQFFWLVLIGFIISVPVTYFWMNKWLQEFAYHINVEYWIFFVSALASVIIAALTLAYESIKAALANPANSMRTE